MDGGTGVTLFEPADLKLNINNSQEDDEEVIEEQKRRDEELKAEVANAFDDWTDEEDVNDKQTDSSGSSHSYAESHTNSQSNSRSRSNGMIFHNLSDISEHSPSKSCMSPGMPKTRKNGKKSINLFSPSQNIPKTFIQVNGSSPERGGSGDGDHFKPIFKNNANSNVTENFRPMLVSNTSYGSNCSNDDSAKAYWQADVNSLEQLQVLYEVRMKDIQRLTSQLEAERAAASAYKQDMFRRLSIMEAEKERALLSRNEATKLLVASKEEIAKLQKEAQSLMQTVANLEKEKIKNDEVMEVSKLQIHELEQRISMMERCDANKNFVKQTDIMVKELKNKHHQEVHQLQQQIEKLNKKCIKKDEECQGLENKVSNLQKMHEAVLVDKSETINKLARTLEESQAQCQQLMASNVSVDNVRLNTQLEDALRDKEELSQTVKTLQMQCSLMQSDLVQFESMSRMTLQCHSSSDETDSIVQLGLSSRPKQHEKSNRNQLDINASLKDELHRSLLNQNAKRAEIRRLQEMVQEKEAKIHDMTKQERHLIAQNENLHVQLENLTQECSSMQNISDHKETEDRVHDISILNAEIAELRRKNTVLEGEKINIQKKLDDLLKHFEVKKKEEIAEHNKEYLKFHDDTIKHMRKEIEEEAESKINEYRLRLEHSLREVTDVKELYVAVCETKEQLAQSLASTSAELQQLTLERDHLKEELQQCNTVRDQLIQSLNNSATNKMNDSVGQSPQHLIEERDTLRKELDACLEMRDHLARRLNVCKQENDELAQEIQKFKCMHTSDSPLHDTECSECRRLQDELSAMSTRLTQELTAARSELHAARDRVVQLEHSVRLQYETDTKIIKQDCEMWKTKCDEKEVQIKKLIESRKRGPVTVSVATETDRIDSNMSGELVERERHERELTRCREEYNNTITAMETAMQQSHELELERLQQRAMQLMETAKGEWEKKLQQDVAAVEERTKQLTVKYFAEEFRKMEARYKERLSQQANPSQLEALNQALIERTKEVEVLQQKLAAAGKEFGERMAAVQHQIDTDRDSAAQIMVHWAQEVKIIQGELKLKEAIIDDQRSRIKEAEAAKLKYRDKLIKTNNEITAQYLSKCAEYKAKMQQTIEESEKAVMDKVKRLEKVYEAREKDLKKKISKTQQIS